MNLHIHYILWPSGKGFNNVLGGATKAYFAQKNPFKIGYEALEIVKKMTLKKHNLCKQHHTTKIFFKIFVFEKKNSGRERLLLVCVSVFKIDTF